MTITTPEPLDLELRNGARLWAERAANPTAELAVTLVITEEAGDLTAPHVLELIGWLARAVGTEPCHLPNCEHVDAARDDLATTLRAWNAHELAAHPDCTASELGDDFAPGAVARFNAAAARLQREQPWPPADATVTHVEGRPQ